MTRVGRQQLRDPDASDEIPLFDDIAGDGFVLRLRSSHVYSPSGAPVYLLAIYSDIGEKLGRASLILEKNAGKVASVGHVCASLVSTAPNTLLQRVASSLVAYAQNNGIEPVRIVVRADDKQSVQASEAIGPSNHGDFTTDDGRQLLVFDYVR